jgi:putative sigma-54 modulation protein
MTVSIQYVQLDSSDSLNSFINKNLEKLTKKYEWLISADVAIKEDAKDNVNGKICSIELSLPGPRIFATSNERNYELAVKETISDLEKQLKKRKETFKTH